MKDTLIFQWSGAFVDLALMLALIGLAHLVLLSANPALFSPLWVNAKAFILPKSLQATFVFKSRKRRVDTNRLAP